MPKGTTMTVTCEMNGQDFMAWNAGAVVQFTPAISFVVDYRN